MAENFLQINVTKRTLGLGSTEYTKHKICQKKKLHRGIVYSNYRKEKNPGRKA
jgi:hypothetical protein